jgi:hypothetical protein
VVCHGIPDDRQLLDGDIMNVDVTVFLNGYHGDTSRMYCVGARRLLLPPAARCFSSWALSHADPVGGSTRRSAHRGTQARQGAESRRASNGGPGWRCALPERDEDAGPSRCPCSHPLHPWV